MLTLIGFATAWEVTLVRVVPGGQQGAPGLGHFIWINGFTAATILAGVALLRLNGYGGDDRRRAKRRRLKSEGHNWPRDGTSGASPCSLSIFRPNPRVQYKRTAVVVLALLLAPDASGVQSNSVGVESPCIGFNIKGGIEYQRGPKQLPVSRIARHNYRKSEEGLTEKRGDRKMACPGRTALLRSAGRKGLLQQETQYV